MVETFGFFLGYFTGCWLGYKIGPRKTVVTVVKQPVVPMASMSHHEALHMATTVADESLTAVKIYRNFIHDYLESQGVNLVEVSEILDRLETIAEQAAK